MYLRELHSGYDLNPTAQIRDLNDRLIGYATLPTGWRVTRATYRLQSERTIWSRHATHSSCYGALHCSIHLVSDGFRSPKTPQRLRDYPGFRPMENNSEVPLTKIDDAINAATALLQPEGATKYLATLKLPLTSDHRAWLDADVAPELHLQMASMFQAQRQFLPFTTQIRDLIYFGKQCGQPNINCLAIDDSYVAAMSELRDSRFWIDVNHLSTSGAAVFTRWLSTHLIAEGVLAK
ncbi:MAG: hypothetical protein IPL91_02030 [Hyphomicrobium sp.]|nr:hypothetical protein [Hyphomicrobium sp.]